MDPKPWSPSGFDTYLECERKFYHESVLKDLPRMPDSPEQVLGKQVHSDFEMYIGYNKPLPPALRGHAPYLDELKQCDPLQTERKVGLNRHLRPTGFFDKDVWWRGTIDFNGVVPKPQWVDGRKRAKVRDWKTGKPHEKVNQLHQYVFYLFCEDETLDEVEIAYYWTTTKTESAKLVFPREHKMKLLEGITPGLARLAFSYKNDIWRPKKNGLCKRYCGVKSCEFNGG